MTFGLGLLIGGWAGGMVGVFAMALMVAASQTPPAPLGGPTSDPRPTHGPTSDPRLPITAGTQRDLLRLHLRRSAL